MTFSRMMEEYLKLYLSIYILCLSVCLFKQFHKYLINFLTAIHIYIICLVVCFYLINVKTAERKTHIFVATHSHMALRGDGWPVRMIKLWLEEMSNFELDQ